MQAKGLINILVFNILLKKAVSKRQDLSTILNLLDKMIENKITPQIKEGKDYTVNAVRSATRYYPNRAPYRDWVAQKRKELENQPRWLKNAWEEFFEKTSY